MMKGISICSNKLLMMNSKNHYPPYNYFPVEFLVEESATFGGTIYNYGRKQHTYIDLRLAQLLVEEYQITGRRKHFSDLIYLSHTPSSGTTRAFQPKSAYRPLPGEAMLRKVATSALSDYPQPVLPNSKVLPNFRKFSKAVIQLGKLPFGEKLLAQKVRIYTCSTVLT